MMLPQELIVALGKIYKTASSKDKSIFATWLGRSKAVKKEEILKTSILRCKLTINRNILMKKAKFLIKCKFKIPETLKPKLAEIFTTPSRKLSSEKQLLRLVALIP